MSGEIEYGKCDICGDMSELSRKYYHYPIKCECHSSNHFEVVNHCNNCEPEEPKFTNVIYKTDKIKKAFKDTDLIFLFLEKRWDANIFDLDTWTDEIKYERKLINEFLNFRKEYEKKY